MQNESLRITEMFFSLQGEARTIGVPTFFIRLTGCPLRCVYCDSEYAFYGGERLNLEEILSATKASRTHAVCVTGGEPLAQPACLPLLGLLCDQGYYVSLETSGALDISGVDDRVDIVMDLKTPDSGESNKNRLENIDLLSAKDQVKFVICSRRDYEWARLLLDQHSLKQKVGEVLFSPSFGQVDAVDLASWILEDALDVRFQMQLHKTLWGEKPGV